MPALSKKQQKFMGIVRSIQKGEQPAGKFSKDAQDAAKDMKKSSVKKYAATKHKGKPEKVKSEATERNYKEEYKKFQSSTKAKKYRAELNKYNRQKGTYGNGDGKDASHKGGKIVGFESQSKNRGRAEKSRLKKEQMIGRLKEMIKQELSEYTYGTGDVVKDVNPTCPHYGAEGKVKSVNPKSVVFVVTNKGDNFKPGQELEKSHDQMKKIDESLNENRDFEKLYNLFTKKDYFNLKNSIKQMLRNYDVALKKGDKGAQKYTKQDIIKSVTAQNKANAKRGYDELVTAIKKKDIKRLKSRLRHNQPYSIAIFNQTTGKKLPKTTRDIHSFLDNEFMNESINVDIGSGNVSAVQKGDNRRKKIATSGGDSKIVKEMSAKTKKIISKLGKKEKEMFIDMVDMMGFDQVMADYKRDKKAFKQALKDMSENINEKKKMFPPLKMTPKQAKEYKKFIGYAKMGVEYQIDMSLFESVNEDGHTDVASAKRKAMLMVEYSNKLLNKLNGMNKEDSLPSWLSDKITLASDYLHKATHYLLNPVESVKESMNPSAVKKMRDEFEKTGQLPPHLKKFALDLKILKKKHKVKNIVVPGLEWMSDMKEVNEGKGVEKVLKMANDQSFGKLGGRTVDALSAGLFKGVYDKASDKNKEKINKMNEKQLYVFMTKLWSKFGNQVRIG